MGDPITWRNVTGANPADALRPMQAAQQSFTDSLGSLEKMLLNAQQQATNIETRKLDEAKQGYLSALDGVLSPEDYQARRADFQKMFSALDPRIQAQVREADDQRYKSLTELRTQELGVADDTRKRVEEPIRDNVLTLAYAGNFDNALKVLAENADIRDRAPLVKAIEAARREGKEFTWKESAEADRKSSSALGRRESRLRIDAAEREKADSEEQRKLDQYIAREQLAYRGQQQQLGLKLGEVAKRQNLPVTADGMPDMTVMSPAQINALKAGAGVLGLGTGAVDSWRNDTGYANKFITGLSGKFRPDLITSNEERIRTGFSSLGGPLVGADAQQATLADAREAVALEAEKQTNWLTPNSAQSLEAQAALEKEIPTLMRKDGTLPGVNPEEDIGDLTARVSKVMTEGFEVTVNGKKTRLVPPLNVLRAAIAEAKGGQFSDVARADSFEKILQKQIQKPWLLDMAARAENVKLRERERAVREKLTQKK